MTRHRTTDDDDLAAGRALAARLGLEPLPHEGGLFREVHQLPQLSSIHFMVIGDDFSALHTLTAPELYFWHAGAALRMLLIDEAGPREELLGPERPQLMVPAGVCQGSSSAGAWTFVSTVMSPKFSWDGFRLDSRDELVARHPGHARRITELTRVP